MDVNGKLRPLYLLEILKNRTDEDHTLSTGDLCRILKEEYGIDTFRTTIKTDIDVLAEAGFGVQVTRAKQNRYNYIERDFDTPEIKLLIDAVMSAKFITKSKSEKLVAKLTDQAGPFLSKELKRNLAVDGRVKSKNEQVYMIVDVINEAINTKKKIRFQMTEYNLNKEKVLHNKGERYTFSPYSLVWDGDNYYVVGYSDKYNRVGIHRVDRIYRRPEILNEPAVRAPKDFDINRYINTMFRMYDAPREKVELQVDNDLMDPIIDRFGTEVVTKPFNRNSFIVSAEIAVGPVFYNWIFGFGGRMKILAPKNVQEEFRKMVDTAIKAVE